MPVGAVTAAVGVYSANQAKKSSKNAANAMTGAADASNQLQWDALQQARSDQAPFRGAGLAGLNEYMAMLGLPQGAGSTALAASDPASAYLQANPDVAADDYFSQNPLKHFQQYGQKEGRAWGAAPGSGQGGGSGYSHQTQQQAFDRFRSTPGYQFGLNEGQKNVETSAAARGGLFSGATGKALQRFGNDYADQQGYRPYMNSLASLAGIGQTASAQSGQWGQQTGFNMGQNLLNAGQNRASGLLASGASNNAGLTALAGGFNDWWGSRDKSLNGGWYLGNNPGRG